MKKLLIIIPLLLAISSCSYFGVKDDGTPKKKKVTGRVYFMGGETITDIGLNDFSGSTYALIAEKEMLAKLGELQDSLITVKGYIDYKAKYPQKSVLVEEYKELKAEKVTGKLYKSGLGAYAGYYLQTKEKTFNIIYDRFVQTKNLVGETVELTGYLFESDDSINNIYLINIDKKEG